MIAFREKDEAWNGSGGGTQNNDHRIIQNTALLVNPSYSAPWPGLTEFAFCFNKGKDLEKMAPEEENSLMGGLQLCYFFREQILLEEKERRGAHSFECLSAPTSIEVSSWQTFNPNETPVSQVFTTWILQSMNSERFSDLLKGVQWERIRSRIQAGLSLWRLSPPQLTFISKYFLSRALTAFGIGDMKKKKSFLIKMRILPSVGRGQNFLPPCVMFPCGRTPVTVSDTPSLQPYPSLSSRQQGAPMTGELGRKIMSTV